jgi:hypothetical protein
MDACAVAINKALSACYLADCATNNWFRAWLRLNLALPNYTSAWFLSTRAETVFLLASPNLFFYFYKAAEAEFSFTVASSLVL